jgi:hypothetical protein
VYIQRVYEAVKDEKWQTFRKSLKGLPTQDKLDRLRDYWEDNHDHPAARYSLDLDCNLCLQVDNYIKALCRGGQLYPRQDIGTAFDRDWQLDIKRN